MDDANTEMLAGKYGPTVSAEEIQEIRGCTYPGSIGWFTTTRGLKPVGVKPGPRGWPVQTYDLVAVVDAIYTQRKRRPRGATCRPQREHQIRRNLGAVNGNPRGMFAALRTQRQRQLKDVPLRKLLITAGEPVVRLVQDAELWEELSEFGVTVTPDSTFNDLAESQRVFLLAQIERALEE